MSSKRLTPNLRQPSAASGGLDETAFYEAFEQVSPIEIRYSRDLCESIASIKAGLSSISEEWERRVEQLRRLRALIVAGAGQFAEFVPLLRELEVPLQTCITDLRSQVVRETCITVAFLSMNLTMKVERILEALLNPLLDLVQNSAKVMSSSGVQALRFIIRFTPSPRFVPIFSREMGSKSNITRRYLCEFLHLICGEWPLLALEKSMASLLDWMKRGINDADQDARFMSRQAFIAFHNNFPNQATQLLNTLDPSKRRLIEKDFITTGVDTRKKFELDGTCSPPIVSAATTERSIKPPKVTSQSQPTSREVSPTRSSGGNVAPTYQPHQRQSSMYARGTAGALAAARASRTAKGTGQRGPVARQVPRSQGASREGSPNRYTPSGGDFPEPWNNVMATTGGSQPGTRSRNRHNSQDENNMYSEQSVAEALQFGTRRSFSGATGNGGDSTTGDVDDNVSEISSSASDAAFTGQPSKFVSEVVDMIRLLQASHWRDRRDGLLNFQIHLESGGPLSRGEMQKISEHFLRLLSETKGKIFMTLLSTIQLFVKEYYAYLLQWLYSLLLRLLTKQGNDLLSSHQEALTDTLTVVQSNFPHRLQFMYCCKLLNDPVQTPNVKTKNCILLYMHQVLSLCEADDVYGPPEENISPADVAIEFAKIINCTMEPKSPEVRKNAEEVVWRLFDLDPGRWDHIVSGLGRSFQENAMRVVHRRMPPNQQQNQNHLPAAAKFSAAANCASPTQMLLNNDTSPAPGTPPRNTPTVLPVANSVGLSSRSGIPQRAPSTGIPNLRPPASSIPAPTAPGNPVVSGILKPSRQSSTPSAPQPGVPSTITTSPTNDPLASMPMKISPEDITVFIRQTTENIQSLSRGYAKMSVPQAEERDEPDQPQQSSYHNHTSSTSPTPVTLEISNEPPRPTLPVQQPVSKLPPPNPAFPPMRYDPLQYQIPPTAVLDSKRAPSGVPDELPPEDVLGEILQELSNHNERNEQRKLCMTKLSRLIKENGVEDWSEHFKTTLFLLLEILGDSDADLRAQSLRVLQSLMQAEGRRFDEYAHLTIMKILESQKDDEKSVSAAAEECSKVMPVMLSSSLLFSVLHPVIVDSEAKIMTAAIRMLQYLFAVADTTVVWDIFLQVAPALVKGCHSTVSEIRKSSIFCLVEVHSRVGENSLTHLKTLGLKPDKLRLLQLFINRRMEAEGGESLPLG